MVPGLWSTHDDAVCPGKRVVLWISACSFSRAIRRRRCRYRICAVSSESLGRRVQQKKFDRFRQIFNHERPHEGLNNETPASLYQRSSVMFPRTLTPFVYPRDFETRRVNMSGDISWHKDRVFISQVFSFEDLGFEEMDEDVFRVYFREIEHGELDVTELRFRPVRALS